MRIIIENPTGDFLMNGKTYQARFSGKNATRNEMDVVLCKEGFSHPNDRVKRFLRPIDPLFWLTDGETELEIECEAYEATS